MDDESPRSFAKEIAAFREREVRYIAHAALLADRNKLLQTELDKARERAGSFNLAYVFYVLTRSLLDYGVAFAAYHAFFTHLPACLSHARAAVFVQLSRRIWQSLVPPDDWLHTALQGPWTGMIQELFLRIWRFARSTQGAVIRWEYPHLNTSQHEEVMAMVGFLAVVLVFVLTDYFYTVKLWSFGREMRRDSKNG